MLRSPNIEQVALPEANVVQTIDHPPDLTQLKANVIGTGPAKSVKKKGDSDLENVGHERKFVIMSL
jgi:hypothetical protein